MRFLLRSEAINKTAQLINPSDNQRRALLYQVDLMGKKIEKYIQPSANFGNPFKTFFWLTSSEDIDQIEKECLANDEFCNDLANKVRDQLGLVHYGKNKLLIKFEIDISNLDSSHLAIPTFIEAGDHRRFKAINDQENCDCGHTADLDKVQFFKDANDLLDGVPEFVCKLVPFSHKKGCSFQAIGFTSVRAERQKTRKEADAHFAKVLENKRTSPS